MLRAAATKAGAELPPVRLLALQAQWAAATQVDAAHGAWFPSLPQPLTSLHSIACRPPSDTVRSSTAAASSHSDSAAHTACPQWQHSRCYSSATGAGVDIGTNPESIIESDARVCWQCGAMVPRVSFYFCNQCNVIQPAVPTADLFLLLDLPPVFDVDLVRLEATYKALQRRLHPDKYSTASPEEKAFSEDQSALVSTAYATLRQPLKRAIYLLERAGRLEAGLGGEGMVADDPLLLARVMEVREQIEDAQDEAELQELHAQNSAQQGQQLKALSAAFAADDLSAAMDMTMRLRYSERVREAIEKRMPN